MIYKSAQGTNDVWNLLTLCWNCHRQHHDGFLTITWGLLRGNGPVQFTREEGYKI